jgi:hypothetical protein
MKTRSLVVLCCLLAPAGAAVAETLVVDDQVQMRPSSVERPNRGATMQAVEQKFGQPAQRHATIGQPPITRWDYPGFSVFFEKDRVIHAVALGG